MIQKITLYYLQIPMKFTFKTAKGEVDVRDTLILRIEDANGHVGYGECVAFVDPFYTAETVSSCWNDLCDRYLPMLIGQPVQMHQSVECLRDGTPMTVAAIENALFHVKCAQLGVNTVEYVMGQPLRDSIPMGVVIGEVPLDTIVDAVATYVEQGCKRIKLKVSPKDGYERVSLVRQAFPHITLAADANQSYSYAEIDAVRAYNTLDLACLEEPFQIQSLEEYAAFKAELEDHWGITTPICLDESILSYDALVYADTHRLLDVLNVKVGRLGGLQQVARAIGYCRDRGISYWIGSMVESSISKLLHVQLAALGDSYMAGDLSDSSRYFQEDLTDPNLVFTEGFMKVPRGVGLGATVDEAVLDKYCVKQRVWTA